VEDVFDCVLGGLEVPDVDEAEPVLDRSGSMSVALLLLVEHSSETLEADDEYGDEAVETAGPLDSIDSLTGSVGASAMSTCAGMGTIALARLLMLMFELELAGLLARLDI